MNRSVFIHVFIGLLQPRFQGLRFVAFRTLVVIGYGFGLVLARNCFITTIGGIHADVIVYIFAHLQSALRTEGNMLDIN